MVRLSKIYTKTGDDGTTGLGDGSRVSKTDLRVEVYGTVDEVNSAIGLCVLECVPSAGVHAEGIRGILKVIQNDLFDVGADLCCPMIPDEKPGKALRVTANQTLRLEQAIDAYNQHLAVLDSFILPGGTALAASLHMARTITRRAERVAVALLEREQDRTNSEVVKYLNRLSDLLFVLARAANNDGKLDIKWVPGAHR